MVQLQL